MRVVRSIVVMLVVVLAAVSVRLLPEPARAEAALAAAAAAVEDCSPNSEDTSTGSAQRCVAERRRSTRAFMSETCPVEPRALVRGFLYGPNDCQRGSGDRIEAIAHMRAVARINAAGLNGRGAPPVGISADLQWEVGTGGGRRADLMLYDRTSSTGVVEVGEVKNNTVPAADVQRQLSGYLDALSGGPKNRRTEPEFFAAYSDYFRVWTKRCGDPRVRNQVIDRYDVFPDPTVAGVLRFRKLEPDTKPCSSNPGAPAAVEDDEDAHDEEDDHHFCETGCSLPRPGRDDDHDDKDDFLEKVLDEHPEIDDLPEWPKIPTPSTKEVVIAAGVAALLVAGVVLFCASTAGGCAGLLATIEGTGTTLNASGAIAALLAALGLQSQGYVHGEPHFVTLDGRSYALQAVGEFHLIDMPSLNLDVQTRLVPLRNLKSVSTVGPVATTVGDEVVELREDAALVNGQPVSMSLGSVKVLDGEGSLLIRKVDGDFAVINLGTDRPFAMERTWRTVEFVLPKDVRTAGLLGNHDGSSTNDLTLPDGSVAPSSGQSTWLHGTFADAWRIDDDESLFTYGEGQSTETFTDRSFPEDVVTLGDLSSAVIAAASAKCTAAGVLPGPQFDACVFDLGVTGDDDFAAGAAILDEVLVTDGERSFAADGTLTEGFESEVSPNLRAAQYSQDTATGRYAGPLFDTPAYRLSKAKLPRHDAISVGFDLYAFGPTLTDAAEQEIALRWGDGKLSVLDLDTPTPGVSGTRAVTAAPTGSGTLDDGTAFHRYRVATTLSGTADEVSIDFAPKNFRGVLGTAFGVDNVALEVEAPAADTFAVSLPVRVPGVAGSGVEIVDGAGRLESNGALDSYSLSLSATTSLVIEASSCDVSTTFELVRAADGAVVKSQGCSAQAARDVPAGQYRLEVTSADNRRHGDYEVAVAVLPDPQTFEYTLGSTVADGVPAPGAGKLETAVSVDRYEFDVPSGGRALYYDRLLGGKRATLLDSSGKVVADLAYGGVRLDLAPGRYTVEFRGQSAGSFSFRLFEIPAPEQFAYTMGSTVANGSPVIGAGNLETPASLDRYTFSVPSSGMRAQYERLSGAKKVRIVAATGAVVLESTNYSNFQVDLPAGTYAVEFPAQTAGTYSFRMFAVPDAQSFGYSLGSTVSNGSPAAGAGNLETVGSVDRYPFTVPLGGLKLQYERVSGAQNPRILDATGAVVAQSTGYANFQFEAPAGDYVVEFPAGKAGTYGFRLFEVPLPQSFAYTLGWTVSNGTPAVGAGNLETVASIDRYPFTVASNGTRLQYERVSGAKKVRILDSTGAVVVQNTSYANFQVTVDAGQYTVEFPAGESGTYGFRLFEVPPPQSFAYTLGTTVSNGVPAAGAGNLETVASVDLYPFTVPSGGRLLQYERVSGAKAVRIRDASGDVVVQNISYSNFQVDLDGGQYTVEFPQGESGTYGFRLFEVPPPQSFVYTLGTTVSNGVPAAGAGNLETVASIDRYPFSVPLGGRKLQYQRVSGAKKVRILDASGALVVQNTSYTNFEVTVPAGDYTVEFPAGESGTYSFRLSAVATP